MAENKKKGNKHKDIPVKIGEEKVKTDPKMVKRIQLGEEDKKTIEMIRKKTITKAEDKE